MAVGQHLLDPGTVVRHPVPRHEEGHVDAVFPQGIEEPVRVLFPVGAVEGEGHHLVFPVVVPHRGLIALVRHGHVLGVHGVVLPRRVEEKRGAHRRSLRQSHPKVVLPGPELAGTDHGPVRQPDLHRRSGGQGAVVQRDGALLPGLQQRELLRKGRLRLRRRCGRRRGRRGRRVGGHRRRRGLRRGDRRGLRGGLRRRRHRQRHRLRRGGVGRGRRLGGLGRGGGGGLRRLCLLLGLSTGQDQQQQRHERRQYSSPAHGIPPHTVTAP